MRHINRVLAATCIVIPMAAMLSIGCGFFALPVTGPKALATNAQRIHFSVDITDPDGNALSDVDIQVRKLSADVDLLRGEIGKAQSTGIVADGHYTFDAFGLYAVQLTFSRVGYGQVTLLCANADDVVRLPGPGGYQLPLNPQKSVNVQAFPQQHVVLSKLDAASPTAPR